MFPSSITPPYSSAFSTGSHSTTADTPVPVHPLSPPAAPSSASAVANDQPGHNPSTSSPFATEPAFGRPTPTRLAASATAPLSADSQKRALLCDGRLSPDSRVSSPAAGHHIRRDGSSTAQGDERPKKRKTASSARGVANLTPEQLAKKRANDREAQRAIRERTKNQIESLERRISELTSQRPYQELQAVIRAKEAVEAENADIKNRLASIMALIQPILPSHQGAAGGESYTLPVPAQSFVPLHSTPQAPPSTSSAKNTSPAPSAASPASVDAPYYAGGIPNASVQPQLSSKFPQAKMLCLQRQDVLHSLDLGAGEHLKLDFLLDPSQRVNRMQAGPEGPQDTPAYRHLPMKYDWNGSSLAVTYSTMSGGSSRQLDLSSEQTTRNPDSPWEYWNIPIKNCAPTCPLDTLILAFMNERRQRAAEGVPTQEVLGPRYPSVSSLLNPATSVYAHPVSKVFTDIIATLTGICTLPEKVAVLYVTFIIMRWRINPSQETYDLLPSWTHPTPAQQAVPHPSWIDQLPFPEMRERLVREHYDNHQHQQPGVPPLFDDFFIPFTTTLSVNWPYEPTDTLLQSPDGSELLINPVFERHLRRLENWTIGESFDKAFPQLRGSYNLKRNSGGGVGGGPPPDMVV
ncbi:hypothetical protein DL764_005054 [Monosporascus ibericus]|uniref:BZIP domain-containing protein n=1 Tax=Monosporascus ibericus TaxID=155417 RepID=A0A4Q4TE74_9PEZI|nr:hypothetical protein DL764_005054 [Monosporascus ibericus]